MRTPAAPRTVARSAARAVSALLVAGLLALPTGATLAVDAGTAPAAAVPVVRQWTPASYKSNVQYWVNHQRHLHGLRALTLASCPIGSATRWAAHLASTGTFYHQSMQSLLVRCNAYYAGETLGRGAMTPQTLVSLWMHSPPHRAVLLSHNPRRIGIGAVLDARGQWVVAANFVKF